MSAIIRDRLLWAVVGFFGGALITNIGVIFTIRNVVVREYRSPQDLASTVRTISTNAVNRGWRVSDPVVLDPDTTRQFKAPVRIVELTHPDYARDLVAFGRNRSVAMAPTTLVAYEENGNVYVASVNTGLIGRFFHHEPAGAILKKEVDERQIMSFLRKRN